MTRGRIRPADPPPPDYAFGYRHPPRSGNEINGLGETERRQPRHVFHSAGGPPLDWQALDDFFGMISPWSVLRHVIGNAWQLRNKDGPVNTEQRKVTDRAAMTQEIKARTRELGADLVGVTRVTEAELYEGHSVPYETAISIGLSMDRDEMAYVPQERAAAEVMRAYREISRIAVQLGKQIRGMGWPARAYGNPNSTDILQIPLAVKAGLGQLGKHGSMINEKFGSNFRLAAVLTDLPLACDEPIDIGVDDLCLSCRRCVADCPWSVPGRGPSLSQKLLAKRAARNG